MLKPRRITQTEANRAFWSAVDRIVSTRTPPKDPIRVGEPWTDTDKDLSASLLTEYDGNN